MGKSWGHIVRPLAAEELERLERLDTDYYTTCRMPKCAQRVTHAIRYSYVTGRAGRTSWAEKNVCTSHAEKFAAKHGVEIAPAPAPEHATQQLLRAIFSNEDGD